MKQTSPIMVGLCVALACISLGAIGYIVLENTAVVPAKVAVVDLDIVAQRLGRIEAINQRLQQQGANYDEQLKGIKENFQSQVTAKENELKSLGPNATDEQKKQLVGMVQVANNKFNLAKREAVTQVQRQKAILVQQFQKEAIAVAEKVAKEQGYDIVVAKTPMLLTFDPTLDITESVIAAMPAAPPVAETSSEEVATASAPEQVAQANEHTYR